MSSSNKQSGHSHNCPECHKEFDTLHGLRSHNPQLHGELPYKLRGGVETTCEHCDERYKVKEGRVGETRFCSQACQNKALRNETKKHGEDHPCWKGGLVEVTCENCNATYQVKRAVEKDTRFCSKNCHTQMLTGQRGEENPNWQRGPVTLICRNCGSGYEFIAAKAAQSSYCSRECLAENFRERYQGSDGPNWKGGKVGFGENWNEQRRKALARDEHRCQGCGKTEDEMETEMNVHHITPRREFEDLEASNVLGNLVCLCNVCHQKWEGIPLKPELVSS